MHHPIQVLVLQEAARLAQIEGISCEVVDLRTLIPLDKETVLASVRKTGRELNHLLQCCCF